MEVGRQVIRQYLLPESSGTMFSMLHDFGFDFRTSATDVMATVAMVNIAVIVVLSRCVEHMEVVAMKTEETIAIIEADARSVLISSFMVHCYSGMTSVNQEAGCVWWQQLECLSCKFWRNNYKQKTENVIVL